MGGFQGVRENQELTFILVFFRLFTLKLNNVLCSSSICEAIKCQ